MACRSAARARRACVLDLGEPFDRVVQHRVGVHGSQGGRTAGRPSKIQGAMINHIRVPRKARVALRPAKCAHCARVSQVAKGPWHAKGAQGAKSANRQRRKCPSPPPFTSPAWEGHTHIPLATNPRRQPKCGAGAARPSALAEQGACAATDHHSAACAAAAAAAARRRQSKREVPMLHIKISCHEGATGRPGGQGRVAAARDLFRADRGPQRGPRPEAHHTRRQIHAMGHLRGPGHQGKGGRLQRGEKGQSSSPCAPQARSLTSEGL